MSDINELRALLKEADARGDKQNALKLIEKIESLSQKGTIFDALGQGVSLGFSDELAGIAGAVPAAFSTGDWDLKKHYSGIRDAARSNDQAFSERNPGTALGAEIAGGLLTGGVGASRVAGLKGAQLARQSGLLGAKMGAASGAGHSEKEGLGLLTDTAIGAGVGGAAGMAFPAAGQALAKMRRAAQSAARPSANYNNAVRVLESEGIPLSGGQVRGSNWQKVVEDQLGDTPLIGTNLQRMKEGQREAFQRGLLRRLGANDADGFIDINRVNHILDDLSEEYGKALKGKFINIADDNFLDDLARIEAKYTQTTKPSLENEVKSVLGKFLQRGAEKGRRDGQWYQAQRSIYAKESDKGGAAGEFAREIVKALDDAFERVAPKVKGDIDKRWAQAKQLQRIAQSGGAEVSEGILPLASLNRLAKTKPGTQSWKDYVNSGAVVLPARVGNSGTAARQQANDFIRSGILAGMGVANPSTIPLMLGARMAANRMAHGGAVDVTRMLPSGALLGNPRLAQGVAANAGLLQ